MTFCSNNMVGMLCNLAAIIGATEAYPPNPNIRVKFANRKDGFNNADNRRNDKHKYTLVRFFPFSSTHLLKLESPLFYTSFFKFFIRAKKNDFCLVESRTDLFGSTQPHH